MNRGIKILTISSLFSFNAALIILSLVTNEEMAYQMSLWIGIISSATAVLLLLHSSTSKPWLADLEGTVSEAVIWLLSISYLAAGFIVPIKWFSEEISGFVVAGYVVIVSLVISVSVYRDDK